MVQTHVINPLTGRRIAIGKSTYKRVMKLRDNVSVFQQTARTQAQDLKKKQNKATRNNKKKLKKRTKKQSSIY